MYSIDVSGDNEKYRKAWDVAAKQISNAQESCDLDRDHPALPKFSWRRFHSHPPCLDHLSFRFGNQLFFVRLISISIILPGSLEGLKRIATENNGHACLFPIEEINGEMRPLENGWGLLDASSLSKIDPSEQHELEDARLTEWELYRLALEYTCNTLADNNICVTDEIDDPEIRPSIWIVDDFGRNCWIYLKYGKCNTPPDDWHNVLRQFSHAKGYFVNVKFASPYDLGTWDLDHPRPLISRLSGAMPFPNGLMEAIENIKNPYGVLSKILRKIGASPKITTWLYRKMLSVGNDLKTRFARIAGTGNINPSNDRAR